MEFGRINLYGGVIVLVMLAPNIIHAFTNKGTDNKCTNKRLILAEQIGRYGCIILMWLPLLIWKFAFPGAEWLLFYLLGNGVMLLVYLVIWILYFKRKSPKKAMALAILPTGIFLFSGLLLHHWLLVAFSVIFGIAHISITRINYQFVNRQ